jgi:hypothetical protein
MGITISAGYISIYCLSYDNAKIAKKFIKPENGNYVR